MSNALNREQKHDLYTRELAMSFERDSLSDAEVNFPPSKTYMPTIRYIIRKEFGRKK